MGQAIAGLAGWLGWVVTLLIAEWWLERHVIRRSTLPEARVSGPEHVRA
jgi:hypothetical protein